MPYITKNKAISAVVIILFAMIIASAAALFWRQEKAIKTISEEVEKLRFDSVSMSAGLKKEIAASKDDLSSAQEKAITELSTTLNKKQEQIDALGSKVGGVEENIGQISGAVNNLEKLSKTDPEFLRKYSKVFFLNENYIPERLTEIPKEHLYNEDNLESIHLLVWPYLKNFLEAAKGSGVKLYIKSAYRSFDEQKSIKSAYSVIYGAGAANTFSADQGYSEHQLGTTADFITSGLGGKLEGFENTEAYRWMGTNAYKYGFILSYPKNNSYYVYEPWHWRFVGVKLAADLHSSGKNFYDLDQREIDGYLVNLFD